MFIFLPAFYLIMWLMTPSKPFEKITAVFLTLSELFIKQKTEFKFVLFLSVQTLVTRVPSFEQGFPQFLQFKDDFSQPNM